MDIFSWILALALISGQLIKLPLGSGGVSLLDGVILFLCLLGLVNLKFKLIKPPTFIKAALVFIVIAVLSLIMTPLKLTFPEYINSFLYTVRFSSFILLGWLIYSKAFPGLKKNLPHIFSVSGIILSILGLLQLLIVPDLGFLTKYGWDPHFFRIASTFLDPNFLGSFLVLTLLITPNKYFFALVYLALMGTFSRGSYLAFLTSFLALSLFNKSIKSVILTLLLFLGLMIGFFSYQRLVAMPRNIDRNQSAEFRLNTWTQGWQLFQMNPVLGVGFNSYRLAIDQYHLGQEQFLKSHGATTNDSSLLFVLATTGILGFTAYIFFLVSLFINGNIILRVGLLGLIAQSFFANTLFYPPLLCWLALIAAIHKK